MVQAFKTFQPNRQRDFPWKEKQDTPDSVIVIPDDCGLQTNDQTDKDVIILSDSNSDCLSLPDIIEPFDLYPQLEPLVSKSSFIQREIQDSKVKFFPPNSGYGHSTQDLRTTEDANVIYISEDSQDLDSIKNINAEVICITSNNSEKDNLNEISPVFPQSEENSRSDFVQDLIKEAKHVGRTEVNNKVNLVNNSSLDPKKVDVNKSVALKSYDYILPYSLQPYTKDTKLGIKDLKNQPQLTVELIRSHLDEGKQFPLDTANIFCLYLYSYRPAQSSLKDFLNWFQQGDIELVLGNDDLLQLPYFKIHGLLNELFYRYPENALILWEAISETKLTVSTGNKNIFLNFAFILEIYLNTLEGDLFHIEDSKKCQVYRQLLRNNKSYENIKKIIDWLNQVVTILIDQSFSEAEKVMCQLEKLLELCIVVSDKNYMLAKRIAKDLVSIYLTIPHLALRQRFLSTIQSELIQFKFLEILLEKYCDGTSLHWNQMPKSIGDVAKAFFWATSLETNLVGVSIKGKNNSMSPSECEELIMFIYFVTISYLHSIQDSFHKDLLNRSNSEHFLELVEPVHVRNSDVPRPWASHMKDFTLYVSKLKCHIQNLNVDLSKESLLYLRMVDSITDMMGEDIPLSIF